MQGGNSFNDEAIARFPKLRANCTAVGANFMIFKRFFLRFYKL